MAEGWPQAHGARATVGLCDDDHHLRDVVRRALEREGFAVRATALAADALRAFASEPPQLLVLDIALPDGDGRDVCHALRAHGVDAPVLFLTGRVQLTDRLGAFAAGGDDFLAKPFDIEELTRGPTRCCAGPLCQKSPSTSG